nr:unnamed protein product [Spirometra erinaceieuropaei]
MEPFTDGVLVHNLMSRHLTRQQLEVLSYDAKFNTRDARPEDFMASFESAPQKCEANEEYKNSMLQQVSTLLLQHKPQRVISEAEDRELLRMRKMRDVVTLPADKGRSTVVMGKTEYTAKLKDYDFERFRGVMSAHVFPYATGDATPLYAIYQGELAADLSS